MEPIQRHPDPAREGRYPVTFEWNRSDTLALAANACAFCHGLGLRTGRRGKQKPCKCVFRAIFKLCYERFRDCHRMERYMTGVSLDGGGGGLRKTVWGRKNEEYMADFYLMSKRTLDENQWRIFNLHYLLGADWHLCCAKLKVDRGTFFHDVYRIQEQLGQAYRETEPYALFPLDEYFQGATADPDKLRCTLKNENPRPPVRPPLRPVDPFPKAA